MTDRPYNTGVYMLRCLELGLHPSDLCYLDEGTVKDMMIEKRNDSEEYQQIATQEDFDRF